MAHSDMKVLKYEWQERVNIYKAGLVKAGYVEVVGRYKELIQQ